jgi:guanylate kinase
MLEVDLKGAEKFLKAGLKANVIFITPPSIDELRRRLVKRGTESPEVIEKRVAIAQEEIEAIKLKDFFAAILINDDFEVFYKKSLEVFKKLYPHFVY